ncbi:hypothetical protein F0562_000336 [Nyssa sinensis]|uniref:Uncharacterized protein n=1 Tax=Nyssa sinensis TaxID=561372 RepID=A0A5J5C419_9ASTE|nr:hypothetical protein F0562_000336 [Nyssa sinensis]
MKTVVLSSSSSVKSTTTTTSMDDGSETRDSCYFPKCRKDANCECDMCLASINATLDLMPKSIQRGSLTKFSASKPVPRSPISFNPSVMSTPPRSSAPRFTMSPTLNSTARMISHAKMKSKNKELRFRFMLVRLFLCLNLIFAAECGFSWVVTRFLQPELSAKKVKNVAEKSWVLQDMNERMEFLKKELQGLVHGKVSNCSFIDSTWEINQDGLLLNSWCTLYKSTTEDVSIWGWPLQTAGLLTSEFSSRSFTVLSGRVTEWSNGKLRYSIRKENSSWVLGKWSSSVVQLDRSTWILEYQQSSIMENSRLFSAALEFLKFRLSREFKKMKQEFWLLSAFGSQNNDFTGDSFRTPT